MAVITVTSAHGNKYYYDVDNAVADALNLGQEDIEFDTLDGFRVRLNSINFVYIAVGPSRYSQPGSHPEEP